MKRQIITVDIAPGNSQVERLGSSQGDIGRPMGVYIIQNGVALDCSAYSAELYIFKPDGKFYTTLATVDSTETNLIKWETALQETPVAGACAAQIRITAGDDDIGTARFVEFVEASPCDMGSASESEVALLTEYVRQARESATSAGRDATTASDAASSASGSASTASAAASTATQAASAAEDAANRAEAVEESIPEDYTQLSDDVTGLKSATTQNDNFSAWQDESLANGEFILPLSWEKGKLTNGEDASSDNSARSIGFIRVPSYAKVYAKTSNSAVYLYIAEYGADKTFIKTDGSYSLSKWYGTTDSGCKFVRVWSYSTTVAPADQPQYISVKYVDEDKIALDEKMDILDDIYDPNYNIFDYTQIANYGFDSGKIISGSQYRGFVWEVKPGEKYTLSRVSTSAFNRFRVAFTLVSPEANTTIYKENGSSGSPISTGDSLTTQTVTVPSNQDYKYAVVYLSNNSETINDSARLMISKGNTAKPWTKHYNAVSARDLVARDGLSDMGKSMNQSIINRNDPTSMEVKLQQLNRPTRDTGHTFFTPPLCFVHFSDIHGDGVCLQNIIDFKKHFSGYIADILHTGDTVRFKASDGISFWNSIDDAKYILNCIGNHDTRDNNGNWLGTDWTMANCYTTYFAPYIANWGAEYTANKTYYYKDYSTNNVRLIVLDVMHQNTDTDQLTWFTNVLTDAISNNLHVIVAVHSRAGYEYTSYENAWDDKPIVPEYKAGFTDSSSDVNNRLENLSDDYMDAVDTFISGGGDFICWLHGHTHYKMAAYLTNHPNQMDIGVANAGTSTAGGTDYAESFVWKRNPGTKSADDFNVVAIDTHSKIIKIVKVGVDYDIFMRHTDTLGYDYGNHILLYAN